MERKDPRQIHSIKKIQSTYLSLLLKENEKNITIQRICQEAKITRPTFYKLYKDVIDLRIHLHDAILHDLRQALTINNPKTIYELRSNDMPENLIKLFEHVLLNQLAYEVLLIYKPDELFAQEVKSILRHFVEEGIRLSKIVDSELRVDLSFLISYTTGAYFESIIWWMKTNYKFSSQEMTAALYEIAFYGPYKNPVRF